MLTGEDVAADGLGDVPCIAAVTNRDGSKSPVPPNPLLKRERVRHVGDAVALVVAETLDAARDAAELVAVDYDPLPVVTDTARAAGPDVPLVWDDAPNNIVYDWSTGDEGRHRGGLRGGYPRHAARLRQQPRDHQFDGAARRRRQP